jgi:hypothetical protein
MLGDWLGQNWWILASVAYVVFLVVLLVVLTRRRTAHQAWPKVSLAITCVIVLTIPAMKPPGSYLNAVFVVLNLYLLFGVFRNTFASEPSSKPSDD